MFTRAGFDTALRAYSTAGATCHTRDRVASGARVTITTPDLDTRAGFDTALRAYSTAGVLSAEQLLRPARARPRGPGPVIG